MEKSKREGNKIESSPFPGVSQHCPINPCEAKDQRLPVGTWEEAPSFHSADDSREMLREARQDSHKKSNDKCAQQSPNAIPPTMFLRYLGIWNSSFTRSRCFLLGRSEPNPKMFCSLWREKWEFPKSRVCGKKVDKGL